MMTDDPKGRSRAFLLKTGGALCCCLILAGAQGAAFAETFRLKTGEIIQGKIRNSDPDYYTIALDDGSDAIVFKSDIAEESSAAAAPKPAAAPRPAGEPGSVAAVFALPVTVPAAPSPMPAQLEWYTGSSGYEAAIKLQQATHAPIAMFFHATWCPYCKAFDRDVLSTPKVQRFLRRVIKVSVDIDRERALAERFEVLSVPTFLMLRETSDKPRKIVLYTKPEPFIEECKKAGLVPGQAE